MVTTTITHTPKEVKEEAKKTFAAKAAAVEEIARITIQLQNCCLKKIARWLFIQALYHQLFISSHITQENPQHSANPMCR